MNFSLEIGPKTELDNLPALKDICITMLPGGDYKDTSEQAAKLAKKGFNPIPHFPARSIQNDDQLKEYVSRGYQLMIFLGPALHGRSRRVSGRCGASRAGSWSGRRWATRPSVALCSSLACCQLPREARQKLSGGRFGGGGSPLLRVKKVAGGLASE